MQCDCDVMWAHHVMWNDPFYMLVLSGMGISEGSSLCVFACCSCRGGLCGLGPGARECEQLCGRWRQDLFLLHGEEPRTDGFRRSGPRGPSGPHLQGQPPSVKRVFTAPREHAHSFHLPVWHTCHPYTSVAIVVVNGATASSSLGAISNI